MPQLKQHLPLGVLVVICPPDDLISPVLMLLFDVSSTILQQQAKIVQAPKG